MITISDLTFKNFNPKYAWQARLPQSFKKSRCVLRLNHSMTTSCKNEVFFNHVLFPLFILFLCLPGYFWAVGSQCRCGRDWWLLFNICFSFWKSALMVESPIEQKVFFFLFGYHSYSTHGVVWKMLFSLLC